MKYKIDKKERKQKIIDNFKKHLEKNRKYDLNNYSIKIEYKMSGLIPEYDIQLSYNNNIIYLPTMTITHIKTLSMDRFYDNLFNKKIRTSIYYSHYNTNNLSNFLNKDLNLNFISSYCSGSEFTEVSKYQYKIFDNFKNKILSEIDIIKSSDDFINDLSDAIRLKFKPYIRSYMNKLQKTGLTLEEVQKIIMKETDRIIFEKILA